MHGTGCNILRYIRTTKIWIFVYKEPTTTSPATSPATIWSPSKPNWHCLLNWEHQTSGTHAKMLSHFLLLPSGHQNIPDGCMIYHSFPNIKNPTLNSPPMSPAVITPPNHHFWHCLHVFTSAPNPCSTALPHYTPLPSHLAPLAYHSVHPLTQKTLLLILIIPSTMAILVRGTLNQSQLTNWLSSHHAQCVMPNWPHPTLQLLAPRHTPDSNNLSTNSSNNPMGQHTHTQPTLLQPNMSAPLISF